MTEIKSLFTGKEHCALYKACRPELTPRMVQSIVDFLAKEFNPCECDAVDVGCGSGQGTLPLASFLHRIVGLDPSEAQINEIKTTMNIPHNVDFRVGEAENLPFDDSSLHLVAVKAALHWFDLPRFFQEVDRVLKPGGVLAVSSGTGFSSVVGHEDEVEDLFRDLGKEFRTPEWTEKRKLVFDGYRGVTFLYEECLRDESFTQEQNTTVRDLMNLLRTRSDVAKYINGKPEEAEKVLKETEEKLMKIIEASGRPEETVVRKRLQQTLILCRKPPDLVGKRIIAKGQ